MRLWNLKLSTNFSAGLVWDVTSDLNITLDYFSIGLEDRISSTGTINIAGEDIPAGVSCPVARAREDGGNLALCLQELGVPGAADLRSVAFYTNDFETTTTGIDLVATYDLDWGNAGSGSLVAAWNMTETEVDDAGSEVNRNKVVNLENYNPKNRGVFTYTHNIGNFRFLVRASYYDDWVVGDWSGDPTDRGSKGTNYDLDCTQFRDECYGGETIVDVELGYTWADNYTLIVGANNALDQSGPREINNLNNGVGSGNAYDSSSPWGIEGGFYYARLRADF